MKKVAVASLCGLLGLPFGVASANAEGGSVFDDTQMYVGISAFGAFRGDSDLTEDGKKYHDFWQFDHGYGVGANVGIRLNNNWRVQLDLKRQSNGVDKATNSVGVTNKGVGRIVATYGILSGYYDLPVNWRIRPFVGLGIGQAQVKLNNVGHDGTSLLMSSSDDALIGQASLGASYSINDNIDVVLEYSYVKSQDVEYNSGISSEKLEFSSHNVGLGVRYTF